MIYNFTVICFI